MIRLASFIVGISVSTAGVTPPTAGNEPTAIVVLTLGHSLNNLVNDIFVYSPAVAITASVSVPSISLPFVF